MVTKMVCRFAELMDLTKDRGRLDFFLKKAKTVPAASLDEAADVHSLSSPAVGRAGSAPAASTAHACELSGVAMSGVVAEEATADPAAENEEALYWQQHGEVEEEEQEEWGFEEKHERSEAAADLHDCSASWRDTAERDDVAEDWDAPAPSASPQQVNAAPLHTVKAEPEASNAVLREVASKEELPVAAWLPARVKHEPSEPHSSTAAHSPRLKLEEPGASLLRFSYTGSPVKREGSPHAKPAGSHRVSSDSRDSKVLVHLGLDSPKAQPPSSMAARRSSAGPPLCPGACGSSSVQGRQSMCEVQDAAQHSSVRHTSLAASAAPQDSSNARQQTPFQVKQEQMHPLVGQRDLAGPAGTRRAAGSSAVEGEALPQSWSPDSWATASEGLQDTPDMGSPPRAAMTSDPVTDICSPESAKPKQPCPGSFADVKRERSSAEAACESAGLRSPGGSECVDLSAVDLAEQQRLLRHIAARKSLLDDVRASRACIQALNTRALPDCSLRKRGRVPAQAQRVAASAAVTKRRQLGRGAFLLSQPPSEGM